MDTMNQTALVIVDSRRGEELRRAERVVLDGLDQFGVPWDVYELGAPTVASDFAEDAERDPMAPPGSREVTDRYVGDRALYVLAHDGAGRMPERMAELVADAVTAGAGLVSFGRELARSPAPLRDLLGAKAEQVDADRLVVADEANPFIARPHVGGDEFPARRAVRSITCSADDATPLLRTPDGRAVAWSRKVGEGRAVVFGCGTDLYGEVVPGHGYGLTGLLWRSVVWAARKPFAMRCHPPAVTARFDDCNGSYDTFGYVGPLNEVGIRPNIGLFIDEMSEGDWESARALFESGGADFSMHAFRDDLLLHDPGWTACRSMDHKPRFEQGAFNGFTLDHFTGVEYDEATLDRNFAEMDRRFGQHGVRHSRVINTHFAETSHRALPRFLARGADIGVNNGVSGQLYGNQPVWRPRPFGLRTALGRYPLVIDTPPDRSGVLIAGVGGRPDSENSMEVDILWGHTPFVGECDKVDVDGAVRRAVRNIEWALDSMAWGLLMAHEQRVACVPPEAWREMVRGIAGHFASRDVEYAGREDLAVMSRRLFHSRLNRVWAGDEGVSVELTGQTDGPSPLTLWLNEGEGCRRVVHEIGPIDGFLEVRGLRA